MGSELGSQLTNIKAVSQESPHKKSKKKRKRENTEDIVSQESPQTATEKSKKEKKRDNERSYDDGTISIQNDQPLNVDESNEQPPMNVKIEVIYDRPDKTPPIVGYFPSGYEPRKYDDSNNSQEPNHEENLSLPQPTVRFYRNAQRTKIEKSSNEKNDKWKSSERMELVVNPNAYNMDFVGKSYKGEATAAQLCTYALGVFDKKTQTLKIMPVAGNKIFRLQPKVRGLDTADKEPSVLENEEVSGEKKADKIMALNLAYGSKASVSQYKKAQALKQGDDPESQRDLGKKIDNVVVNKEALESASAHVARNIPPHNTSATTPKEAYPLNRIILTGEWDFLEDIYEILQGGAGAMSNAYPSFVRNRIHKLQEIQDEVEKKTLSHIFSYITHLIKFKDLHSLDGASSAKTHRFPSILRQKFVEIFTPESRRLPIEKTDLLISYVLVLTLYADDFRTDPTDIAKDLKVSPVNLRVHFENLGCKLVRENKLLLATLPVPLTFPTQRQKRRR